VPYTSLDAKIKNRIQSNRLPKRLLAYALDTTLLSDAEYQGYAAWIEKQTDPLQSLMNLPWVTALVWIRCIFETCNGNDVWDVFRGYFHQGKCHKTCGLLTTHHLRRIAGNFSPSLGDRIDFLRECWLVEGSIQGHSSEIWKILVPLIRKIPANPSPTPDVADQCAQAFANSHALPAYFGGLIQNSDPSFLESLVAMRQVGGSGWLGKIAPLWQSRAHQPCATAEWKLCVNGRVVRLDLFVDDIYVPPNVQPVLTIQQPHGFSLSKQVVPNQDSLFFTFAELSNAGNAGFDPAADVMVYIGGTKVDQVDSLHAITKSSVPVVFRYPDTNRGDWLPKSGVPHIYSPRLAILRSAQPSLAFQYAGNAIAPSATLLVKDHNCAIDILDFNLVPNAAPQRLDANGKALVHIGTKPYIDTLPSIYRWVKDDDVVVVFGSSVQVDLKCHPQNQPVPEWSCKPGASLHPTGLVCKISVSAPSATPYTIACGNARMKVMFLPATTPVEVNTPDVALAQRGLKLVQSTCNGVKVDLLASETDVVWWWEDGVAGQPQFKKIDFNDYGALVMWQLNLWVPDGQSVDVSFNGTIIESVAGPIPYQKWISPLVQSQLNFSTGVGGGTIDHLTVVQGNKRCDIADILRVPNHPALTMHNGNPHVFFPSTGFTPADYRVVCCRESGIKSDLVDILPNQGWQCGQLNQLTPAPPQNGEEVWLLLVRAVNAPTALSAFAVGQFYVASALQWQAPSGQLKNRLAIQNLQDEQMARGLLGMLDAVPNLFKAQNIFCHAVQNQHILQYSNLPQFWKQYFGQHCQLQAQPVATAPRGRQRAAANTISSPPAPLEQALGLILKAGFNWCAEPNWMPAAYADILAMQNSSRPKKPRKGLTAPEEKSLKDICKPILAQLEIEAGDFPQGLDQKTWLNLGDSLLLKCPASKTPQFQAGVCFNKIDKTSIETHQQNCKSGILTQSGKTRRKVDFDYHNKKDIQDPYGLSSFLISMDTNRQHQFLQQACGAMGADGYRLNSGNIGQIFKDGIKVTNSEFQDILSIMEEEYDFSSQNDSDQVNRPVIFRVAVLSRLHAWLGWNSASYPAGWPLSNPADYNEVAGVVDAAWSRPECRKALMKDMISAEWMLTWFSEYK